MKDDKPTSFDIAYRAGVSQSTVSRALRNSPLVNEETRLKVQQIARELNYKVDKNASSLRSQQTKTIALLLCEDHGTGDSLINPFFLSMLGSITRATAIRGYDLLISFQQFSEDWHADYEDANRADGIIFLGYGDYEGFVKKLTYLTEVGAHFITWGPVLEGQPGVSIGCDNFNSAYHAAKHLIGLGRKQIAFLGDVSEHSPEFRDRYLGFCKALQEAGVAINPQLQVAAETSEEEGYKATLSLLQRRLKFDAVFGASDLIAIGAIKALEEAELHVPRDVAVMGFDDIPMASYTHPPLTTVRQDTLLAGELLVENLLRLVEGQKPESLLLPAKLVVRGSCGEKLQKP
ncbi:LacI family DNA-binding transcriptional regulator [Cellvibrio japonicus]|uniref:Transcriptional regulator, LacI family n=1 Tax=Cellvibrio japonicus (strain Ueda107) TaxID=498211 RepID=B3PK67_CELJU|nr:LacI family DNA-binding transcriptional regulator [Cellvibrio japonicus]ACE83558.1 transcriptional regulator, LacI family [Cellvibrio japonicus Ueda107]QEI11388.1 LacI family transcriptional regulator [Cellvibrio japonicus]QEI14962.1 LacI family transcriptional regulator [Cellvibrio japonicus]QEI18542.1 LacI family transcriptional regulator [Cellvibrio japonicus]